MNSKLFHRITAGCVFIITVILYISTMQPSFAFWDPGEYTAVSAILGIPHPPGVPFNVLIGKIFSMIPLFGDMGMRIAFSSVLSSAAAVLFVYLISVKVIIFKAGMPDGNKSSMIVYISSAIGALSLAFCGTFWFNAMETESESKAIFFISLMLWLMFIWREKHNERGSDRYLLMCFFLTGLGVGAHLLVVQTILITGLIFFLYKYEATIKNTVVAFIIIVTSFFIIFPGIIIKFPQLIASSPVIGFLIVVSIITGIFYKKKIKPVIRFVLLSVFFVILGYSIYTTVLLRAAVNNLPVNQNSPNTFRSLVSYLEREQYGQEPKIWPRRWSDQPQHRQTWENYSSDLDFLWRYQIRDMYLRYLAWQFVGRKGYNQGDGVDPGKLLAIPLFLGFVGLFFAFKRDKKNAIILLTVFLTFGVFTALYQNQQNMQPREREYFYVVSYMIYAIWIGLGVYYITDAAKRNIKPKYALTSVVILLILFIIAVPLNMLRDTYKYQNRSGNYLPFDYAYNILQSVEKDAILITNGDNDTFPLWCLQSVYGIRTDVRVINLSLANASWYNLQLKNERPYGSLKVPFTYSDEQLRNLQPTMWDENKPFLINVPETAYPDTMVIKPEFLALKIPATIRQRNGNQTITALQVSDLIVLDIIKSNDWQRPIYFSATVTDNFCLGLTEYLQLGGMAQKLLPYIKGGRTSNVNHDITEKCLMNDSPVIKREQEYGFLFRNINNPGVFYDEVHERAVISYRMTFLKYALSISEDSLRFDKAKVILQRMENLLPRNTFKIDFRIKHYFISLYNNIGEHQKALEYANESLGEILAIINSDKKNSVNMDEACLYLTDIYLIKGEYNNALESINKIAYKYPNDPNIVSKKNEIVSKIAK